MGGKLYIEVSVPSRTGLSLAQFNEQSPIAGGHRGLDELSQFFAAIDAGLIPAYVRMSADDSTGVAATITVTCTQSAVTAGDTVWFVVDGKIITLTAATSGTTVNGDGTFQAITSDTVMGANLATAINTFPGAVGRLTAANSSGVVTVTAAKAGAQGNTFTAKSKVASSTPLVVGNSGAFAGGIEPAALTSCTIALSGALTANDTVTIGGIVLTGVVSPANESQFAATVSAAADGAALAACINAHSKLKGLVLASGTSTVTVTYQEGGRSGALVTVAKSASAITLTGSSFAPTTTDAWAASVLAYNRGVTTP